MEHHDRFSGSSRPNRRQFLWASREWQQQPKAPSHSILRRYGVRCRFVDGTETHGLHYDFRISNLASWKAL